MLGMKISRQVFRSHSHLFAVCFCHTLYHLETHNVIECRYYDYEFLFACRRARILKQRQYALWFCRF